MSRKFDSEWKIIEWDFKAPEWYYVFSEKQINNIKKKCSNTFKLLVMVVNLKSEIKWWKDSLIIPNNVVESALLKYWIKSNDFKSWKLDIKTTELIINEIWNMMWDLAGIDFEKACKIWYWIEDDKTNEK